MTKHRNMKIASFHYSDAVFLQYYLT